MKKLGLLVVCLLVFLIFAGFVKAGIGDSCGDGGLCYFAFVDCEIPGPPYYQPLPEGDGDCGCTDYFCPHVCCKVESLLGDKPCDKPEDCTEERCCDEELRQELAETRRTTCVIGQKCYTDSFCHPTYKKCTVGGYVSRLCFDCDNGKICSEEGDVAECVPELFNYCGGVDQAWCHKITADVPGCSAALSYYGMNPVEIPYATSDCPEGWLCCQQINSCGDDGTCYMTDDCSLIDAEEADAQCDIPGWICCEPLPEEKEPLGPGDQIITPTGTEVVLGDYCGDGGNCVDIIQDEVESCTDLGEDYEEVEDTEGACAGDTQLCCGAIEEELELPEDCMPDCESEGQRECISETEYQVCGFDEFSCLKWVSVESCQEFYKCEGGECVVSCIDMDGDGYGEGPDCTGEDCDDNDANINPDALEECNGIDDNCNDEVDEGIEGPDSLDKCDVGSACCPEQTDCLVSANGNFDNNYKPETYYTSQKPRCVSSGQFVEDHVCLQGEWISRTGAIASQLLDLVSGSESYSLFCSNYEQALNNYEFLVGNDFVDDKYIKNCKINNIKIPCVNNFCVLSYDNKVVAGTSLNLNLNEQNFLKALKYNGNCNNALGTTDGQFNPCSTNKVWFNAQHNSIIFSDKAISLRPTNFLDAFIEFLKNPIETLLEAFGLPAGAEPDITASNVYLLEADKGVEASVERVCNAGFDNVVVVSYSGVSTNMCAEVNKVFPETCFEEAGKYYVLANDNQALFEYWNDLTAKLRMG